MHFGNQTTHRPFQVTTNLSAQTQIGAKGSQVNCVLFFGPSNTTWHPVLVEFFRKLLPERKTKGHHWRFGPFNAKMGDHFEAGLLGLKAWPGSNPKRGLFCERGLLYNWPARNPQAPRLRAVAAALPQQSLAGALVAPATPQLRTWRGSEPAFDGRSGKGRNESGALGEMKPWQTKNPQTVGPFFLETVPDIPAFDACLGQFPADIPVDGFYGLKVVASQNSRFNCSRLNIYATHPDSC